MGRRLRRRPGRWKDHREGGRARAGADTLRDFNGIEEFEKKVDFYHHDLDFDPPYGIKFGSNWQVSTRKRDVKDGGGGRHAAAYGSIPFRAAIPTSQSA